MNKVVKSLIVSVTLAAAALSTAQGGRRMGGMFGGAMNPSMILFTSDFRNPDVRSDVSKELKLTSEQVTKLLDINQKSRDELMSSFQAGGGGAPDMEAIRKKAGEVMSKADKDIQAALTDEQKKRLKELYLQRSGSSALTNADIQKDLGLSDEQKTKIKDQQSKQQQAMMETFQKMQDGSIDRSEIGEIMEKQRKTLEENLLKVLTDDQKKKFEEMKGTPFKFEDDNS